MENCGSHRCTAYGPLQGRLQPAAGKDTSGLICLQIVLYTAREKRGVHLDEFNKCWTTNDFHMITDVEHWQRKANNSLWLTDQDEITSWPTEI
jgi:hypothetical protein